MGTNSTAPRSAELLTPPWSIVVLAWIIRLSAGLNLVVAVMHQRPEFIRWLGDWLPFEISEGRYIRMFMTGLLLLVLATGLMRGKRAAWYLTIVALAVSPLLHLGRAEIWPHEILNLVLIGVLVLHRRYFVAKSDWVSVRWALIVCPILALILVVYGSIRLYDLRYQTSGDDDWAACLQTASELILVHSTQTQVAQTSLTVHFFSLLRIGGSLIALVALYLLMRPVIIRRFSRQEYREKVQQKIDLYGIDPMDPYALLDDKNYFFTDDGKAVVPYVLSGTTAVALADPIGHPEHRVAAIAEFAIFCREQDWEPVFYEVNRELLPQYEHAGFSLFKIGEEARIRSDEFHLKGQEFQNLRTARNRAHKLGITFHWYQASREVDEVLEADLQRISTSWLEKKKAREMSFDMGSFDLTDIRRNSVGVAVDVSGKALAFATWRAFARGNGQALDLMRALSEERNIMDFVLVESILYFQAQGIHDISLGTAPLANTDGTRERLIAEEKVVQFLFENLNRIYRYKSLFEFKRKYRPKWRGRYVAYRRGVQLPLIGLALVRVHAKEGLWKFLFR